ncbi:hypothetical protein BpHYR1_049237 [Brachionus plicatilis]|uniref:Uncharacterized protein n=1 Tax=Brachionus plicatilis TaxID=10195 RepID=A0A3M7RXA8_BRAPC|nr:hypothetical protein BpHYR1_049237 [Brachionus plicatilis]
MTPPPKAPNSFMTENQIAILESLVLTYNKINSFMLKYEAQEDVSESNVLTNDTGVRGRGRP